jgi:site-specific DNA-methyltransferase (adenine-specific)
MIVKISQVKPNPKNPRTIRDDKFQKLVKSIQDFPQMLEKRPLVCFTDTDGKYVVLGGNMRLKASKEVGLKELPIILADDWTEEQKAEFLIKDNVGFGEWDWEQLTSEWDTEKLDEWGLDVPVFEDPVHLAAEEDDFDVPEGGIETDIVLGDLFEIGPHRLLCGDSTDSDQVAKLMNGEKADMVFTDPPYNVDYGNIKHPKFKQRAIENDNMSGDEFKNFCQGFVSNIVLFCDGIVYCWAGPGKDGRIMFTVLDENLHNSTMIVWNKDQFTLRRGKYQNKHEVCWFGWNKSGASFTEDRTLTNVWDFDRPKKSELHPTMKPIQIVENGLNHSSKKGDIILDLFGGSGSTMVGCNQLQRKGYLMELDPKYCQVIIDRMKKLDPSLVIKKNGEVLN